MKKIKGKPKLMLYALAGMGVNMLNLMVGSYLCSALIATGFAEKVLPYQTYVQKDIVIAGVWAVFALIARIIDGVIDIPMASFTDRLKSKYGRRRPSLIIGLVPMIIAYVLFLAVPNKGGATLFNTVYYGVLLSVFYIFYTLTMVTYYATYTEIVETERERTTISNTKSFFDIVYFILGYVVVRMMLNSMNIRTVALMVLPLVLTMLIPLFMIKEESSLNIDNSDNSSRSVNLFTSIKYTFKNRTFILWMIVYAFMTFSVQLFLGGINEYFASVGMNMMFVMMSAFAPVPFALLLYNSIKRKYGFGTAFRYTLITYTVGMAAMFLVGKFTADSQKLILSIITGLISSLAIGSMFAVAYSVPSQLAAEEEEKTGVTNSAMYFAVQGLFAGVASGLATGVVLTVLKKIGVNAVSYMTLICAIGTVVAFALTFILPKKLMEMGREAGAPRT